MVIGNNIPTIKQIYAISALDDENEKIGTSYLARVDDEDNRLVILRLLDCSEDERYFENETDGKEIFRDDFKLNSLIILARVDW